MASHPEVVSSSEDEEGNNTSSYMVYCNLCKIGFSGTVPYKQHLKGSQHKKQETKKFMKEKYGEKYLDAMAKLKTGEATSSTVPDIKPTTDKDDEAEVFTCTVCKKVCTGVLPYQLHLASRSHHKQVKKQQLVQKLKSENVDINDGVESGSNVLYETLPELKPFAFCSVCGKSFTGPEAYKQHLESDVHKKEIVKKKMKDDLQKNGIKNGKFCEDADNDSFFVTCDMCKKSFTSAIPYQQHLLSEAHKGKIKDSALIEKVGHMMINDEEGSIQCAECGKTFSGLKPLYQHIVGPAHAKQKKRDVILEELHSKFPEFMKESSKTDSSDDETDFLLCTICHKSFSGPESARDHFRSQKHLKAKKEKSRIEKLKTEKKKLKAVKNIENFPSNVSNLPPSNMSKAESEISKNPRKHLDSLEDEFEMI